jgi:hypothetical protein
MRLFWIVLTGLLLSVSVAWAQEIENSAPFTNAEVCGQCHKDIHAAWQENRHSRAATTPTFLRSLEEAEETGTAKTRHLCLMCHAPTVTVTGDLAMQKTISKESVTCDFCHSMVEALPGDDPPFKLEVGLESNIKRGPYKDASDANHGVAFSPIHVSALLCATCHEYETESGVAILSTYSEYLEGPYARRHVPCQGCHMPIIMAQVVDPKVQADPKRFLNLHRMPGGHSVGQLQRALELKWGETGWKSGELQVQVAILNVGAGHRVPTGMPTRRLLLEVEARTAAGKTYTKETVFQKQVVDARGRLIKKDGEMFLRAHHIRQDNRIRPGEKRELRLSFLVPSGVTRLTARLVYESSPFGTAGEIERVSFASIETTVR